MDKKNNINIILLLVLCLTMAGCIKKMNLYQGDKKEVISDIEFLYPFNKETTTKNIEISIHFRPERQISNLTAEIPPLKYNKEWLFMLTQDDCVQSAFAYTWAAIHGKPLSKNYYYDLAHLQEGDLPPDHYYLGKTLATTDGTGRDVRFAFTTTLSPECDFMNASTEINKGFSDNYFRFYMKSGLVWGNVKEMLNYGTGIAFHDMELKDEEKNLTNLTKHFNIAQNLILDKLQGRGCKMLAEPNGDKIYIEAGMNYSPVLTMALQSGGMKLKPFQVHSDLKKATLERVFNDDPNKIKDLVTAELILPKEERSAIYVGVHNTDTGWVELLKWLNDTYGRDGDDTMWFPNQEEYFEYNYYRVNSLVNIRQEDQHTWKLTTKLVGENYFYYPSVTINIPGIRMEDIDHIESNEEVTGFSYGKYKDGVMLNIDCRKYLVEHAENFVKRFEANPTDESARADANYFVSMLKDSDKKAELKRRIEY